ncbi:hypothetical protein V1294_006941 [Bradyrhizobium sp. AZCC 1678]|uniref:hypothetical protein n=1 Tax=Bradyrhizobium sp. AZCC 1678 TaxID=3117030 RepID=UPI002FF3F92E
MAGAAARAGGEALEANVGINIGHSDYLVEATERPPWLPWPRPFFAPGGNRQSRRGLATFLIPWARTRDTKKAAARRAPPAKRKPLAECVAVLQAENRKLREENDALIENS